MSNYGEMKKAFHRGIVAHGIYTNDQFRDAFPLGYDVPRVTLEKWFRKFRKVEDQFSSVPRHVNHFKLGADPEFVFSVQDGTEVVRIDAHALGLKQGPAFGEDNNGRLAEIRPYPSRSALEVCASILATLRWMAILYKNTTQYFWQSGAFLYRDGLGGHVHFGRKRPTRADEVRALDNVMEMLMEMGVYPKSEVQARRAGDARGQLYGRLGDYRMQTHGYEYRTFPSWLDSPSLAFFTLVMSKLTVHDPGLVLQIQQVKSYRAIEAAVNLLAYYRDLDDDARLAHIMVQRGIPKHNGGDFKDRWGITAGTTPALTKILAPTVIPMAIKPDKDIVKELWTHIMTGQDLKFNMPACTWSPAKPPSGYRMAISSTETLQRKGLGELIWNWCYANSLPISFTSQNMGERTSAIVSISLTKGCTDSKKLFGDSAIKINNDYKNCIFFNSHWLEGGKARLLKKWLLNGSLPVWKVDDVKDGSYEEWDKKPKTPDKAKNTLVFSYGGAI